MAISSEAKSIFSKLSADGMGSYASELESIMEEWESKVDFVTNQCLEAVDEGLLKAAIYCEGQAKENAMVMIYNVPVPVDKNGIPRWKRTGLYKASIRSGMDPFTEHQAILYNMVPYAEKIEYGFTFYEQGGGGGSYKGVGARPVLSSAISMNQDNITEIVAKYLKGALPNG